MHEAEKHRAALAAADEVQSGMIVGIGTGSTVAQLIPILAARVHAGLAVTAVATSAATARSASAAGIPMMAFADLARIDLGIDGVDEIDDAFQVIKGAGGALLREKIVATAARRMIAIADGSKHSHAIGRRPVPVEILPFARTFVLAAITALGAVATLRLANGQPVRSDQGNLLADCVFGAPFDPARIALHLSAIPGMLGHGLFLTEIDALYIARGTDVARHERAAATGPD